MLVKYGTAKHRIRSYERPRQTLCSDIRRNERAETGRLLIFFGDEIHCVRGKHCKASCCGRLRLERGSPVSCLLHRSQTRQPNLPEDPKFAIRCHGYTAPRQPENICRRFPKADSWRRGPTFCRHRAYRPAVPASRSEGRAENGIRNPARSQPVPRTSRQTDALDQGL